MLINIDFRWLKQGIKNRNSVLNRVGKSAILICLKQGQGQVHVCNQFNFVKAIMVSNQVHLSHPGLAIGQQQQQQHFISPHNIQEIKIYNNSTDDDRGAGCLK